MDRRKWAIELIAKTGNIPFEIAEAITERLEDEGVLHLGYGDADIDKVVEKFKTTFGTTSVSKYDRFAARRLVDKYGSQAVVGIIGLLAARNTDQYAPVVNNVSELEKKFVSVMSFLRKSGDDEVIVV